MDFEADLAQIRTHVDDVPRRRMLLRHQRRVEPSASGAGLLVGQADSSYTVVALYELRATIGARPTVVVEIEGSAEVDSLDQGSEVEVLGWPAVGRAIALHLDRKIVEAVYPCTSPVFRPMRFK